jgi:hypothetical protein
MTTDKAKIMHSTNTKFISSMVLKNELVGILRSAIDRKSH